jgi:hypothetical protein
MEMRNGRAGYLRCKAASALAHSLSLWQQNRNYSSIVHSTHAAEDHSTAARASARP